MLRIPSFTLKLPMIPAVSIRMPSPYDLHVYAMVLNDGTVMRNVFNPLSIVHAELVIIELNGTLKVLKDRWGSNGIMIESDEADLLVCRAVNRCLRTRASKP